MTFTQYFRKTLLVLSFLGVSCASSAWRRAVADEDALQTPQGTPLKVIAREPTALYRDADSKSANEPVEAFQFYYVLPAEPGGREKIENAFYRVGNSAHVSRPAGWLPADKVVEWPHAQCGGFTVFNDRDRVLFFATAEDAVNWLSGAADSEKKAISREPGQKQQTLFPLLEIREVEHGGEKIELYKVAYLSGAMPQAPTPAAPATAQKSQPANRRELQQSFTLQVVFVLDTTASMQPWIDAMKAVIAEVSRRLAANAALKGRVEFGLVVFRDKLQDAAAMQKLEYVSKIICDLTPSHEEFQQTVATVREAEISSEDFPEDVLAGLKMAIQDLHWKKAAYKHIVLIGDAPAQLDTGGYKNTTQETIPGILTIAQPTGAQATWDRIQIHGLRIVSQMEEMCREHFNQITAGREYPGIHSAYAATGDEKKFIEELTARLADFASVTEDVVAGKFEKIQEQAREAAPGSARQRLLGPVLEMIRATESESSAPASFQEGWAVVLDRKGNRALEPHVLVSQAQLKLFASALQHCIVSLETAGDPGNRNVEKVVHALQILATGINLKEDVQPDMPLSELLSKVLGFPVRNPIFEITPKKLASMTSKDFESWKNQVRASQSICTSHLENGSIWFHLGTASGKSFDQQAFVKVSDLP